MIVASKRLHSIVLVSNLSPDHLIQALCKVSYVACIQAGHRNPSVCRQVDVELVDHCLRLRWTDSCEAVIAR